MTVEHQLSEIRVAMATLSAVHATGAMTRADMGAAVRFVEACCDDIARQCAPAGMVTIPVLTLAQLGAQARANARQVAGRRHLRVVSGEGDAA